MTTEPTPQPEQNQTIEVPPRKWYTHSHMKPMTIVFLLTGFVLVQMSVSGFTLYTLWQQQQNTEAALARVDEKVETVSAAFDAQLVALTDNITLTQSENSALTEALKEQQDKVARTLEREIERVTDTVGDLEKLSKTDPELLQKYSKVSFLNEHYEPPRLTVVPKDNLYDEDQTVRVHSDVWPFLRDLLDEAEEDGIELYVKSGYRSFEEQRNTKNGHVTVYGEGTANTFSADQGYSEHQLGTTIDFITTGINGTLTGFENTAAYDWLLKNAHKYGFVLSYPEGNQYYIFEPWHWRFVGEDLADYLEERDKYFYDLDQREIDKYLIEIFD